MLHGCVRKFDATVSVANFLESEQGLIQNAELDTNINVEQSISNVQCSGSRFHSLFKREKNKYHVLVGVPCIY